MHAWRHILLTCARLHPFSPPSQHTNGESYLSLFVRVDISIWVSPEHNDISDRLANPREYESATMRNMAAMCSMLDEQGIKEMPDSAIKVMRASGVIAAMPSLSEAAQLSGSSTSVGFPEAPPVSPRSLGSSSSSFSFANLGPDANEKREAILSEISAFQQALKEHVKTSRVPLSEIKARVVESKRMSKADDAMRKKIQKNDAVFEKHQAKALQTLEKEVIRAYRHHYKEVNARRSEVKKLEQVRGAPAGLGSAQRSEEERAGGRVAQAERGSARGRRPSRLTWPVARFPHRATRTRRMRWSGWLRRGRRAFRRCLMPSSTFSRRCTTFT